jgi:hypothetical protein
MRLRRTNKRRPVKLTIDPTVRAAAEELPEVVDRGLSALVERLLRREIGRKGIGSLAQTAAGRTRSKGQH